VPNFSIKGKGTADNMSFAVEAWSLLFADDILNFILKCTNQEIERRFGHRCNKNRNIT